MRRRCRRIGWSSDPSLQKTTATTGSEPELGVQAALQRGVGDAEPHHHPPPQPHPLPSQPSLRQRPPPAPLLPVLHHARSRPPFPRHLFFSSPTLSFLFFLPFPLFPILPLLLFSPP